MVSTELQLTQHGMQNYEKVLALIFEYFRLIKDEWLADGKGISFFDELKVVNDLNFKVYSLP